MKTEIASPWPAGAWRQLLADAVDDLEELFELLGLDDSCVGDRAEAVRSARSFALRVPRGYLARMRPGDPGDPLLRQVLPLDREMNAADGFGSDPVGEVANPPSAGVLHKYRGRALVMVTGACAVHCRYCFRRHFPYVEHSVIGGDIEAAVSKIASDPEITEVVLSGGDPLTVTDPHLEKLTRSLTTVPHVRRLRIHTRLPIVLPQRVDTQLIRWMEEIEIPLIVVVHTTWVQVPD